METDGDPEWVTTKREEDRRFSRGAWSFWWKANLFGLGVYLSSLAIQTGLAAILVLNLAVLSALAWAWRKGRLTYGMLGVALAILVFQLSIPLKREGEPFTNGPLLLLSLALFLVALFLGRKVR